MADKNPTNEVTPESVESFVRNFLEDAGKLGLTTKYLCDAQREKAVDTLRESFRKLVLLAKKN